MTDIIRRLRARKFGMEMRRREDYVGDEVSIKGYEWRTTCFTSFFFSVVPRLLPLTESGWE